MKKEKLGIIGVGMIFALFFLINCIVIVDIYNQNIHIKNKTANLCSDHDNYIINYRQKTVTCYNLTNNLRFYSNKYYIEDLK